MMMQQYAYTMLAHGHLSKCRSLSDFLLFSGDLDIKLRAISEKVRFRLRDSENKWKADRHLAMMSG